MGSSMNRSAFTPPPPNSSSRSAAAAASRCIAARDPQPDRFDVCQGFASPAITICGVCRKLRLLQVQRWESGWVELLGKARECYNMWNVTTKLKKNDGRKGTVFAGDSSFSELPHRDNRVIRVTRTLFSTEKCPTLSGVVLLLLRGLGWLQQGRAELVQRGKGEQVEFSAA